MDHGFKEMNRQFDLVADQFSNLSAVVIRLDKKVDANHAELLSRIEGEPHVQEA